MTGLYDVHMTADNFLTVRQTPTGWHIVAGPMDGMASELFTADLHLCPCDGKKAKMTTPCPTGYHRFQVQNFVKAVARTYSPKPFVPEVPFDASMVAV